MDNTFEQTIGLSEYVLGNLVCIRLGKPLTSFTIRLSELFVIQRYLPLTVNVPRVIVKVSTESLVICFITLIQQYLNSCINSGEIERLAFYRNNALQSTAPAHVNIYFDETNLK